MLHRFEGIHQELDVVPAAQVYTVSTDEDGRGAVTTLNGDGRVQAHLVGNMWLIYMYKGYTH